MGYFGPDGCDYRQVIGYIHLSKSTTGRVFVARRYSVQVYTLARGSQAAIRVLGGVVKSFNRRDRTYGAHPTARLHIQPERPYGDVAWTAREAKRMGLGWTAQTQTPEEGRQAGDR